MVNYIVTPHGGRVYLNRDRDRTLPIPCVERISQTIRTLFPSPEDCIPGSRQSRPENEDMTSSQESIFLSYCNTRGILCYNAVDRTRLKIGSYPTFHGEVFWLPITIGISDPETMEDPKVWLFLIDPMLPYWCLCLAIDYATPEESRFLYLHDNLHLGDLVLDMRDPLKRPRPCEFPMIKHCIVRHILRKFQVEELYETARDKKLQDYLDIISLYYGSYPHFHSRAWDDTYPI
jgi:hypothetical protein